MSVADPDIDLATYVATNVAALTLGTNTYHAPVGAPEDGYAHKAVFFIDQGAPAADQDNGSSKRQLYGNIQVVVRSEEQDYRGGKDLADAVYDVIELAPISGYINVRNLREPGPLGADKGGRFMWSWEAEMIFEES